MGHTRLNNKVGTIGGLSIRIDRALEKFYLFVIRECSCIIGGIRWKRGPAAATIKSEIFRTLIYVNAQRLSGMRLTIQLA